METDQPPSIVNIPAGKRICYVTGKLRNDTEEEKVRQRVARSLVGEYGYKKSDLDVNVVIRIGSKSYPVDLVVFREGEEHVQDNIYVIIETKKENIKSSDRYDGVGQLKSYMSASLNCEFGVWTNGVDKLCFQKVREKSRDKFEDIIDIPIRGKSLEEYEKVTFDWLRPAFELKSVFKRCHNYISANQGLQKTEAFHELLKIIFCKVQDEKGKQLKFYVTNQEMRSQLGLQHVKERMDSLFEEVKNYHKYKHIYKKSEEKIELEPNSLAYVVSQLQYYSFLQTDTDVKGEAYEEIVGSNLRGDRGEFFTPRNVCKLAVECIFSTLEEDQWTEKRVLDPSCGTGGFLVAVINFMKQYFKRIELEKWHDEQKAENMIPENIKDYCEKNLHGMDFNPLLVRATQMNEVMHGNGSGNLFSANSLLHPNRWPTDVNKKIILGSFDVIFTNPPFGSKIPITDQSILVQFDLGHIWDNITMERKEKIASAIPPEDLFIERCIQLLKPGGRLAIVLPDSILSNPGKKYLRHWLLKNARVLASIDLPKETFLPHVGTETSLLIVQKKTEEEKKIEEHSQKMLDYDIFMAIPKHVGHDRRGNPVYKATPEGEVVLSPKLVEIIRISNKTKIKEKETIMMPTEKDDLPQVATAFKEWWKGNGQ